MTISQTAENLLEHPYFRQACRDLLAGNRKDMKILLIDLMSQVSERQNEIDAKAANAAKFYVTNHMIKAAVKEKVFQCNLTLSLPIPDTTCLIVELGNNSRLLEEM